MLARVKGRTHNEAYTVDAWQYDDEKWLGEENGELEDDYDEASHPASEGEATSGYPHTDPEDDGEEYEDYELSESVQFKFP